MTEIYLNETKLDFTDKDKNANISDLIKELEKELHKQKQIISSVEIDGIKISEWHSKEIGESLLSEKNLIKIQTTTMNEFFLSSLEHSREYLDVIKTNTGNIVKWLRSGAEEFGQFILAKMLDDINEWIKTVSSLNKMAVSEGISLFKEDPSKYYSLILKNMEEIKNAQDNQDMVLLGDILEYEVVPLLEKIGNEMFKESS